MFFAVVSETRIASVFKTSSEAWFNANPNYTNCNSILRVFTLIWYSLSIFTWVRQCGFLFKRYSLSTLSELYWSISWTIFVGDSESGCIYLCGFVHRKGCYVFALFLHSCNSPLQWNPSAIHNPDLNGSNMSLWSGPLSFAFASESRPVSIHVLSLYARYAIEHCCSKSQKYLTL